MNSAPCGTASCSWDTTIWRRTSFYQPLDVAQRWFIEPHLLARQTLEDIYFQGDRVSSYDFRDAGRRRGYRLQPQQLRAVARGLRGLAPVVPRGYGIGRCIPRTRAPMRGRGWSSPTTAVTIVSMRRAASPRWWSISMPTVHWELPSTGSAWKWRPGRPYPWARTSCGPPLRRARTSGTDMPFDRMFTLGGPGSFPGFELGELRTRQYWSLSSSYLYKLTDISPAARPGTLPGHARAGQSRIRAGGCDPGPRDLWCFLLPYRSYSGWAGHTGGGRDLARHLERLARRWPSHWARHAAGARHFPLGPRLPQNGSRAAVVEVQRTRMVPARDAPVGVDAEAIATPQAQVLLEVPVPTPRRAIQRQRRRVLRRTVPSDSVIAIISRRGPRQPQPCQGDIEARATGAGGRRQRGACIMPASAGSHPGLVATFMAARMSAPESVLWKKAAPPTLMASCRISGSSFAVM